MTSPETGPAVPAIPDEAPAYMQELVGTEGVDFPEGRVLRNSVRHELAELFRKGPQDVDAFVAQVERHAVWAVWSTLSAVTPAPPEQEKKS